MLQLSTSRTSAAKPSRSRTDNMSSNPILYYVPGSPPARTVLLVAKALGLQLDLKVVDLGNKEHLEPWFLALNPQHTVPTLVDTDGRSVWESGVIATYLIGKYGGNADHPLYPRDLYTRARIEQRLQFNSSVAFAACRSIFFNILFNGATGWSEQQEAAVHEAYGLVETFLGNDDYVAGNQLTVADFSLITTVTQLASQLPLAADKYPKTLAWIERLEQLEYFKEINTDNLADFVVFLQGVLKHNREVQK